MSKFLNISTDNTLGGNASSNEIVSSQKAIKEYIDAKDMVVLDYGTSTWQDFIDAYTTNRVVYCHVTSGSGSRLAFMAYLNNTSNPTEVEFQYYRSMSAHSESVQGDEVYIYKLSSNGTWTTTTRKTYTKIDTGTGLSKTYSDGVLTLANSAAQLSGLSDVAIASLSDSQVLTYNSSSQNWYNASPAPSAIIRDWENS